MKTKTGSRSVQPEYSVIHFEALGPEATHLQEETERAVERGDLPRGHACLITPDSVQDYLESHPGTVLPPLVTTKTHSVLPARYLAGPRKSVVTRSAGYDHFEHLVQKANVASLREYCVNAVAQTAMKFLYAAAGKLNHYAIHAQTFERKGCEAFMELGEHRVMTVFGVGKIGKRICELGVTNGLTVQGVDLRADALRKDCPVDVTFVSKEVAVRSSDIIICAMNLTKNRRSAFYNVGYFSKGFLAKAKKGPIFINVTRGEIAPESALLAHYRAGLLSGIGLDVFSREAEFARLLAGARRADADLEAARELVKMSAERSGNIYVQPHQGFNSDLAAKAKAVEAVRHLSAWYRNNGERFDEQLPYY